MSICNFSLAVRQLIPQVLSEMFSWCSLALMASSILVSCSPEAPRLFEKRAGFLPSAAGVFLADFDGDGSIDALLAGETSFQLMINDGSGNFVVQGEGFGAGGCGVGFIEGLGFDVGDVDADGDLDLFVVTPEKTLWINDGHGDFKSIDLESTENVPLPSDIALGDLDQDGDLDAVAVNYEGDPSIQLLRNDGKGRYSASEDLVSRTAVYTDVELGDFNGDGRLDVIALHRRGEKVLDLWLSDERGDLQWSSELPLKTGGRGGLEICDIDRDKDLDVLVMAGTSVIVVSNDGLGRFSIEKANELNVLSTRTGAPNPFAPVKSSAGFHHIHVEVADINQDGFIDLICSGQDEIQSRCFLGSADGVFFPVQRFGESQTKSDYCAELADLDADGDLDIWIAGEPCSVWMNTGRQLQDW